MPNQFGCVTLEDRWKKVGKPRVLTIHWKYQFYSVDKFRL